MQMSLCEILDLYLLAVEEEDGSLGFVSHPSFCLRTPCNKSGSGK